MYIAFGILLVLTRDPLTSRAYIIEDTKIYAPGDILVLDCDSLSMPLYPHARVGWAVEKDYEQLQYLGIPYREKHKRYKIDDNGVLTVRNMHFADTGKYYCVAADKNVNYIYKVIVTDANNFPLFMGNQFKDKQEQMSDLGKLALINHVSANGFRKKKSVAKKRKRTDETKALAESDGGKNGKKEKKKKAKKRSSGSKNSKKKRQSKEESESAVQKRQSKEESESAVQKT